MPSSETSNPYDQAAAIVAAQPARPEPSVSLIDFAPLGLAALLVALIGSVIWRKRAALLAERTTLAAGAALLTCVWFLWFTGTLDNDQAKSYAIALPLATIALRAIWKLARQ